MPTFIITTKYGAALLASPQVIKIQAAIAAAVTAYQSIITSVGTATFVFDVMSSGLGMKVTLHELEQLIINFRKICMHSGQSSTYLVSVPYQAYRQQLAAYSSSTNDQTALTYVPNQANDPVVNGGNIWLKTALARTLGWGIGSLDDSTVSLNTNICNLDRITIDPSK